ncbi:MAG: DUF4240 domain-containing protein [Bacteroidota bacterium]
MGLFDKLFGKKQEVQQEIQPLQFDITKLSKTEEMLDEDLFWAIVDESPKNTDHLDDQELFLIKAIEKLTPQEMIGFRLRTDKLLFDSYTSEMWCAGYLMNGGCSDDGFEYFRNWVISRGKDTYYKAKENPDTLISQVGDDIEDYDFESFWYVALEAFNNKTGEDLYDYIDEELFLTKEGHYPKFDFNWKEEDPASMKKICPKLFDRFWG